MPTPRISGVLDVEGQEVYWEQSGSPEGIPALYLHGGPGSGLGNGDYLDRFDLGRYRVIGLEQRGCGRSRPLAGSAEHDLAQNTTQRLIDDIELLREQLEVPAWIVNGVSWGSTLALAYAQAHPQRVLGMVLMAVTTTRADEVSWITEGCQSIYPEAWDKLATFVEGRHPEFRRGHRPIVAAVSELLGTADEAERGEVCLAWGEWEDTHVAIGAGGYSPSDRWADAERGIPFAILVTHYWSNHGFLELPILSQVGRIAHIPAHLIHGRRDISGPAQTAWLLHQQWPASVLTIVEDEGHGGPKMVAAWARANTELADQIAPLSLQ